MCQSYSKQKVGRFETWCMQHFTAIQNCMYGIATLTVWLSCKCNNQLLPGIYYEIQLGKWCLSNVVNFYCGLW